MSKNNKSPNSRIAKLESQDDEVFKKAYLELKDSLKYTEEHFNGFPMHRQFQEEVTKYTPRFNKLASQTT